MHLSNDGTSLERKGESRVLGWCLELVRALFPVLLTTYMLVILLESIFPGRASPYIDLDWLLLEVIATGIAALILLPVARNNRRSPFNIVLVGCAGIGAAFVMWYKTETTGWISYLIGILSGGTVVSLAILFRRADEGKTGDEKQDSQDS